MKVFFVSLGCDKNSVDSEVMLSLLSKAGHTITDDEYEADIAVINTCCFIGDAKEESISTIIELGRLKEEASLKLLIITGCLGQRYKDEIHKELPEVDVILGTNSIDMIVQAIDDFFNSKVKDHFRDINDTPVYGKGRLVTTGGHYDYLKIAEGCNKRCTYCVIPYVRGAYRSVPMEELIKEAKALAEGGVRELILVAQEITLYGTDLYGHKTLPELLRKLCEIPDLSWIRLLYCYPEEITDELIEVIADEKKIVKYIDIPIQSGSDEILRRMGRRTTHDEILSLIKKLREQIPGIAIRTTLISGFPGETKKDHLESVRLVKEASFEKLGVFTYSPEEDTPAFSFPDQIKESVKEKRRDEIMSIQQDIAFKKAASFKGDILSVFVEGYIPEDNIYVGRTYMDAPDVDGYIFIDSDRELNSGDMVRCEVTSSNGYDLVGKFLDYEEI